ncbi:MAG: hypothetical protein ABSB60_05020 [Terracidiphilus sp.]
MARMHLHERLVFLRQPACALVMFVGCFPLYSQVTVRSERNVPESVTLKGPAPAETIKQLRVVRQYPLNSLRANPHITLGAIPLDFTPVLNNPKSLPNLALRLHTLPQHVEVKEESSEINEVDQGLIIHHVLSFRVLPGKCADASARAQLSEAGIGCFQRSNASQRLQEFSIPGNARYVADPGKRREAIASYQTKSAQADADLSQHISALRKALADPRQRGTIESQVGKDGAARWDKLTDDQLKEEIINSSTRRFEETAFVPKQDSGLYAKGPLVLRASPSSGEVDAAEQLMKISLPANAQSPAGYPRLLRIVPATSYRSQSGGGQKSAPDQPVDIDLGTYIYLTGFTLGHDYEWSMNVSITINYVVSSSTFSISPYAGFNYGFGLRFPVQAKLSYHNAQGKATFHADYVPIEGDTNAFRSTGLPEDQLFDGKELVAQVGAKAGVNYSLPVIGSGGIGANVGVDFTDWLPSPYKGGRFQPPAPGTHGIDTPYVFDQIDLLGGLLNFGVLGGQVFPAININLHSNKLQFTFNDEVSRKQTRVMQTGETIPVGVDTGAGNDSHFSFGNPVYNLGFTLTPGIDARLFVDVAVWSDSWDWPVWFPQLSVDLPPGGMDFGCHSNTACVLDFEPKRETSSTSGGLEVLKTLGCDKQGNKIVCRGPLAGYTTCLNLVSANSILGVESCDGTAILGAQDKELTSKGCARINDHIGDYTCPGTALAECVGLMNASKVISCELVHWKPGFCESPMNYILSQDAVLLKDGCKSIGKYEAGCYDNTWSCPRAGANDCALFLKYNGVKACEEKK